MGSKSQGLTLQMESALATLKGEIKAFEKVSEKHAKTGACDTEPEWQFQNVIRKALRDGTKKIPQGPDAWELYTVDPSMRRKSTVAAKAMSEQAAKVADVILDLTVADLPECERYLADYCWRVDL